MKRTLVLSFACLLTLSAAMAADMRTAMDALSRGDYQTAFKEFWLLAEAGDPDAQAHLGYMYQVGEGVVRDPAKSVEWYRQSALQGNPDAQYNLGVAYVSGDGVRRDLREANRWYELAAEQGNRLAQFSIGLSYLHGEGAVQNMERAVQWFERSASQGYSQAQLQLGTLYLMGAGGLPLDYETAAEWYQLAAEQGEPVAQYKLGTLYRSGRGVPRDQEQARYWLSRAAEHDYADADKILSSQPMRSAPLTRSPSSQNLPTGELARRIPIRRRTPLSKQEMLATEPVRRAQQPQPEMADLEPMMADESAEEMSPAEQAMELEESQFFTDLFGGVGGLFTGLIGGVGGVMGGGVGGDEMPADTERESGFFADLFGGAGDLLAGAAGGIGGVVGGLISGGSSAGDDQIDDEGPYAGEYPSTAEMEEMEERSGFFAGLFGGAGDLLTGVTSGIGGLVGGLIGGGSSAEDDQMDDESAYEGEYPSMADMDDDESMMPDDEDEEQLMVEPIATAEMVKLTPSGEPMDESALDEGEGGFFGDTFGKLLDEDGEPLTLQQATSILEERDYEMAYRALLPLAENGDSEAQYLLATLYLNGDGVEQNDALASHWFALAADRGNTAAQSELALLESRLADISRARGRPAPTGESVDPTYQGVPAQAIEDYNWGLAYSFGDGVTQSDEQAFEEYMKAAEMGYPPAQYKVGLAYAYGEGVEPDQTQAAEWYDRAASKGYTLAQRNLANLYLKGHGVQQDLVQAHTWYNVISMGGNVVDIKRRDELTQRLTEEELEQSQSQADEIIRELSR